MYGNHALSKGISYSKTGKAKPRANAREAIIEEHQDAALEDTKKLGEGQIKVVSPGGRHLIVSDIFVPANDRDRGAQLPTRFRNMKRKVVLFANGSVTDLSDVKQNYKILSAAS